MSAFLWSAFKMELNFKMKVKNVYMYLPFPFRWARKQRIWFFRLKIINLHTETFEIRKKEAKVVLNWLEIGSIFHFMSWPLKAALFGFYDKSMRWSERVCYLKYSSWALAEFSFHWRLIIATRDAQESFSPEILSSWITSLILMWYKLAFNFL